MGSAEPRIGGVRHPARAIRGRSGVRRLAALPARVALVALLPYVPNRVQDKSSTERS